MKHATDNHQKVDIQSLMHALPVSGLAPEWVASIGGIVEVSKDRCWLYNIVFKEPPAGKRVPYIEPVQALEILLHSQGIAQEDAKILAIEATARMRGDVADNHWVNFFDDFEPESPEYLPVPDFVAWLRDEVLIASDILDYFSRATEVATSMPMFRGPENWEAPWSLKNLPSIPPPKAMIEFVPGPPWNDFEYDNWQTGDNPFLQWREKIRPIALDLEKQLGEPVYYFKELGELLDDDAVHRFLVLHWCCTRKPESPFVRYLMKVSGAKDVEKLKTALIDPASYTHPFKMNDAFVGLETLFCRFDYLPPDKKKTVGVVFLTEQAREVAQALLPQQIGAHAFIVAPKELATEQWVKEATPYCRGWTVRYVYDGKLDKPIDILASVDRLFVVANEPRPNPGFDLKLSDQAEDLLWLAISYGAEVAYYSTDRMSLGNPEVCLQKRGVPERVAAQCAHRAAFTRQLKEIHLGNDFGSSGLWDAEGRNLGYDLLDLPFLLVKRIAAWQRNYDDAMNPQDKSDRAWWERHEQEALDLAKSLQTALGESTVIKLHRKPKTAALKNR